MLILLVYLLGMPVMFWLTSRMIWRELNGRWRTTEWDGSDWVLALAFTVLWPVAWIALLLMNVSGWVESKRIRVPPPRWAAPKSLRKELDNQDES